MKLSRIRNEVCGNRYRETGEIEIEESSIQIASGQHDLKFIKMNGRLQVDLYNFFRREENLVSYKLDYVAGHFIGDFVKTIDKNDFEDTKHLPISVVQYILRSYANKIVNDKSEIRFKLFKDCNFLFAEPLCLLNTQYEEGSVDIKTGIAIKDINKDEEIFGNYGNSSQIKLI